MINSISMSSINSYNNTFTQSLSDEQKTLIEETLAKFNPDTLTQSEAQEIISTFEANGIKPSSALDALLTSAGFEPSSIGETAGLERPPGNTPPPPPKEPEIASFLTEILSYMSENADQYTDEEGNVDQTKLIALLNENFGVTEDTKLISFEA